MKDIRVKVFEIDVLKQSSNQTLKLTDIDKVTTGTTETMETTETTATTKNELITPYPTPLLRKTPPPSPSGGTKVDETEKKYTPRVAILTVSASVHYKGKLQYGETKSAVTGPISLDNKLRYCIENGWDLVVGGSQEEGEVAERSSRWLKVYYLLQIFGNYDIIIWMDIDTLFTTPDVNMIDIIDESKDIYLTPDIGNYDRMNSGVFMLNTTEWSRNFFEEVWKHNDGGQGLSDQRSINYVFNQLSMHDKQTKVQIIDRKGESRIKCTLLTSAYLPLCPPPPLYLIT